MIVKKYLLSLFVLGVLGMTPARASDQNKHWVASWTTPISNVFAKIELPSIAPPVIKAFINTKFPQQEFKFALPNGQANNLTFRMIVRPDIWGNTVRIRLSNLYGSKDISLANVTVGLQQSGGVIVSGTNSLVTFSGKRTLTIPSGQDIFSDPVELNFVQRFGAGNLRGRNLAISFAVDGDSGPLSAHISGITGYISNPNSGDHTADEGDSAFSTATQAYFLVKELDVMAAADTKVICAVGDSITDTASSTDGYDGWAADLSERLHKAYGDKVSVVNMGIGGNTLVSKLPGPNMTTPLVGRLDRDVLSISGLTTVLLLEGINDLGAGQSSPAAITDAYKEITGRLHAKGVRVIGATLTSSYRPKDVELDGVAAIIVAPTYWAAQTNEYRKQINDFIRHSGTFDAVVDMSAATEDPATGALFSNYQGGDYLHPNRAGHQAMAAAADLKVLFDIE